MRLADKTPPYCAGCFGQDPSKRHIEFKADFDGPFVMEGSRRVAVNQIVLCEDCVRSAARLIEMVDAEDLARIESDRAQLAELRKYRADADKKLRAITKAIGATA